MKGAAFQQKEQGLMTYPATPLHRAVFRAPLLLWRLGLGPVMGRLFMLITQTGRKSGLPRRTLVEYHALGDRKYVVSAFGARAHWFRNIEADPHVTIQTAFGTQRVAARRVTRDDEVLEVYTLLMERNPVMMSWYLETLDITPTAEDVLKHKDRLHILTFERTDAPTPPPLEADLVWVWGLVAGLLALRLLFWPWRQES